MIVKVIEVANSNAVEIVRFFGRKKKIITNYLTALGSLHTMRSLNKSLQSKMKGNKCIFQDSLIILRLFFILFVSSYSHLLK